MTTDKLNFTPVEGHVVIDFNKKNSKITPNRAIDIALRILSKQHPDDLENFFRPVYNAMIEEKMQNYVPKNDNEPKPPNEPEAA
jgi:hypothetical protein